MRKSMFFPWAKPRLLATAKAQERILELVVLGYKFLRGKKNINGIDCELYAAICWHPKIYTTTIYTVDIIAPLLLLEFAKPLFAQVANKYERYA